MLPEMAVSSQSRPRPAADDAGGGLAQQLAELPLANLAELRARFRQLYRRAALEQFSRDLIGRLVGHRLQEKRLGGLDRELAAQLDRLARGQPPAGRRLKPGTVLVREHEGIMHEVVIVAGGYLWNGQSFASLSTIAKKITGTSWNGPRFFGLRMVPNNRASPRKPAGAASGPEVTADA